MYILTPVFHQKLKCTEQDVIQALEVDDQSNPLRIAYNLIVDNKISKHIGMCIYIIYALTDDKCCRIMAFTPYVIHIHLSEYVSIYIVYLAGTT